MGRNRYCGISPPRGFFARSTRAYVGYPAEQESIEGTNAIVRQIASELSIDLVDLAELIEDQESLFTDGVHFTSEGNHRRSDILLEYFREELGK